MMNPFEYRPWWPRGTNHWTIGSGSSCYIAPYGDSLVLKHPLIPPNEKAGLYDAKGQAYRHDHRSRSIHSLAVEKEILQTLGHHPRIIRLHEIHEDGLVLEYMPNDSVEIYLRKNKATSVRQRLKWGRQAAEAVAYCHTKNVLHCDISDSNILLDENLDAKLADFQGKLLSPVDGTVLLDGGSGECASSSMPRDDKNVHTISTDLFALGSTLYYITTESFPFPDLNPVLDYEEIEKRFRARQLPHMERHRGGEIIRGCWTGLYQSAEDIVKDLKVLEEELEKSGQD